MSQTGIISGLASEAYHSGPGVSNSMLSDMAKSPAHCWALHLDPKRPPREPTKPMLSGTLAHCAVLEPGAMESRYITVPEGAPRRPSVAQWNAKKPSSESMEAMAWWSDFNRSADGLEIISAEQYSATREQLRALNESPDIAALLALGEAEQSAYWTDRDTGLLCRCRPDFVHPMSDGRVILMDLKTTADITEKAFSRTMASMGYYRQAAWYTRGYERASGNKVAAFVFAAVTSAHPFLAKPYMLEPDAMQQGDDECTELLEQYAECTRTGNWPVYTGGYQLIGLPAWARRSEELEFEHV